MKKFLVVLFVLFPGVVWAWTANVVFDTPQDETHKTVVLVSETSGDYSAAYGQISDPGATELQISNIKPATQYYAIAYRVTDTNERSENSVEYPFLSPENVPPVVYNLPPLMVGGKILNLSITVE